jgi:hypothetical protein
VNLTLRHQLTVLNRQARKPKLRPADRLLWVVLGREDKGCSGEGDAQPIAFAFIGMNRLHRLIPAVVGGLLGMNLVDNPRPFTLPQVTFAVCTGMVTRPYFFVVKGWL